MIELVTGTDRFNDVLFLSNFASFKFVTVTVLKVFVTILCMCDSITTLGKHDHSYVF